MSVFTALTVHTTKDRCQCSVTRQQAYCLPPSLSKHIVGFVRFAEVVLRSPGWSSCSICSTLATPLIRSIGKHAVRGIRAVVGPETSHHDLRKTERSSKHWKNYDWVNTCCFYISGFTLLAVYLYLVFFYLFKRHYALRLAIAPEFFYCSYMRLFRVLWVAELKYVGLCMRSDVTESMVNFIKIKPRIYSLQKYVLGCHLSPSESTRKNVLYRMLYKYNDIYINVKTCVIYIADIVFT